MIIILDVCIQFVRSSFVDAAQQLERRSQPGAARQATALLRHDATSKLEHVNGALSTRESSVSETHQIRILTAAIAPARTHKADIFTRRYQESEGSDFGEEEEDSDAEAPRKLILAPT